MTFNIFVLGMVVGYLERLERRFGSKLDSSAQDFIDHAVSGGKHMQNVIPQFTNVFQGRRHGRAA